MHMNPADAHLLRYRESPLWVLPSQHYSIPFALVARQCDLRGFDRVMLELPASLDAAEIQSCIARLDGAPGVILLPNAGPFGLRIPESEEDDCPDRRDLYFSSLLPVVHDSMITTLRAIALLGTEAPAVEFIDADPDWTPSPDRPGCDLPPIDPQEVTERGLETWFRRWTPWIEGMAPDASDTAREAFMAARLRRAVRARGERILFICGAAHWPRLRGLLDAPDDGARPSPPRPARPARYRPRLVALDAATMYSWQLLDIPYVAGRFERSIRQGATTFDRDEEIRRLFTEAYEATGRTIHPRALLLALRHMARRVASDARWSADLDVHILPAARAAAGVPFRSVLERESMKYPIPPSESVTEGRVLPIGGLGWVILTPTEAHLFRLDPPSTDAAPAPRPFRQSTPARLTSKEKSRLDRPGRLNMKPVTEERLHKHKCDKARILAHALLPGRRRFVAVRFRGRLEGGVEYKRTLRALAGGQPQLFVRRRVERRPDSPDCDLCPVVWVFDAQASIAHRLGDWFPDIGGDRLLYSSFFWFSRRERIGPAYRNQVAYFVRLIRNITPSWDRELVEKSLLDWMPADRRCNEMPWYDSDLADRFEGPDLAVASGVRWTMTDHVTVVRVDPRWSIGANARAYAEERGVTLLEPPAGAFDPILLDRYQRDHEIPTRDPWVPPDPLFLRYVEPVPGFDDADPGDYPPAPAD